MKNIWIWFLVVIISFITVPVYAAATYILEAGVLEWDGTGVPNNVTFPGAGKVTASEPWIRSPQCVRVMYSSTEISWGIRIVTDNQMNFGAIYPRPLNAGPDGQWEWEKQGNDKYKFDDVAKEWLTGDDSVSFAGLIDPSYTDYPQYRPALAWQVFSQPVAEPDNIYKHPIYGWWNVGTNPKEIFGTWMYPFDWGYVTDLGDKWNGETITDGVFYPSPPYPEWSLRYEIVANGTSELGWLAQYPPNQMSNPDPKLGDGWDVNGDGLINELDDNDVNNDGHVELDMWIYLAACFAVPAGEDSNGVPVYGSPVPAGNYGTKVYIELIHE